MSRKFLVLALGTMVAAPVWAQGQTSVGTTGQISRGRLSPLDTMRAMMLRRNPTIDEVLAWSADVARKSAELKAINEKSRRENPASDETRQVQLRVEVMKTVELLQTQRVLAAACDLIRPHQDESEGVLGFQIEKATSFQHTTPVVREERFVRTPEIVFVEPNTPAAKAGVREGDVWLGIAGRDLVNTYVRDLNDVLKPDNRVDLKLLRDGRPVNLEVVARKRSEFPAAVCDTDSEMQIQLVDPGAAPKVQIFRGQLPTMQGRDFLTMKFLRANIGGAEFVDLSNEKRAALNSPLNEGVLVNSIAPGSPSESAGLKEFDVVTRVNNEVIDTVADFLKAHSQATGPMSLWVYTKGVGHKVMLATR